MQTRERIVKSAKKLFNLDGYNNTSIQKIIDETGVQKGGIYYYFSDKETLGFEVIKKAEEEFIKFLNSSSTGKTAAEKIVGQFTAILNYHKQTRCRFGCIFGNIALEMANGSEGIRKAVEAVFGKWEKLLGNLLEEAANEGDLNTGLEDQIENLSKTIVATIEGGIMLSKTGRDYHHLETVLNSIILLIFKGEMHGKNSIR